MKPRFPLFLLLICLSLPLGLWSKGNESIPAGPFQGHTTDTEVHIWATFYKVKKIKARLVHPQHSSELVEMDLGKLYGWKGLTPATLTFSNLLPATRYRLEIEVDDQKLPLDWKVRTRDPKPKESWSFLFGSCAYAGLGVTELVETKARTRIFQPMAEEQADHMLWLGDNVYYLAGEWNKDRRMMKRNLIFRYEPLVQAFMQTCPQYSIWDDHDFGPNDSDGSFDNKEGTLAMFQRFWANPAYGTAETPGVFYHFSHQDADFFMLDGRYHRISPGHKQMLGPGQMDWLKRQLKASKATFKFLALGSQVLNPLNDHECWHLFDERQELLDFLKEEKIEGVIFLTGDRHFSEILKVEQEGMYPLYDITCSPLASWLRKVAGRDEESQNPLRVPGSQLIDYNYGKIHISGPMDDRVLQIEFKGIDGEQRFSHEIKAADLRF